MGNHCGLGPSARLTRGDGCNGQSVGEAADGRRQVTRPLSWSQGDDPLRKLLYLGRITPPETELRDDSLKRLGPRLWHEFCLPQDRGSRYLILGKGCCAEPARRSGDDFSGVVSPMPRSQRRTPRPARTSSSVKRRSWRLAILAAMTSWNRYQVGRVIGGLILTWLVGAMGLHLVEGGRIRASPPGGIALERLGPPVQRAG